MACVRLLVETAQYRIDAERPVFARVRRYFAVGCRMMMKQVPYTAEKHFHFIFLSITRFTRIASPRSRRYDCGKFIHR
jgi:hypothetical protein